MADHAHPLALQCATLRRQNDALRERVALLEAILSDPVAPYAVLGLPNLQERAFVALMRRPTLNRDQIYVVLYGDRREADQPDGDNVHVIISKLRKSVRRFGVRITARRFAGYEIPAESKAVVRRLVERAAGGMSDAARAA